MPLPPRVGLGLIAALMSTAAAPVLAQTSSFPPGVEADWLTPRPRPALYTEAAGLPSREDTMAAVEYVASSQIAAMAAEPIALSTGSNLTQMSSNWVAATFYVGAARLARVSDDPETLRFLSAVADHYNYSLRGARSRKTLLNADDIGGPSVKPYQPDGFYEPLQFPNRRYVASADAEQWRRGVYMHWQRMFLHPMLVNFDAPTRE